MVDRANHLNLVTRAEQLEGRRGQLTGIIS
jgi:hypothetical protein